MSAAVGSGDLRHRLKFAREAAGREGERIEAERAKIADGTAEPVIMDALPLMYARAGEDPAEFSETMMAYAEWLVIDAVEKARRTGHEPDAGGVGDTAAKGLRAAVRLGSGPRLKPFKVAPPPVLSAATPKRASTDLSGIIRRATKPHPAVRVWRVFSGAVTFLAAVFGILKIVGVF